MGKVAIALVGLACGAVVGGSIVALVMNGRTNVAAEAAADRTKMAHAAVSLSLLADGNPGDAIQLNCTWAQQAAVMVNFREIAAGRKGSELDRAAAKAMDLVKRVESSGKCSSHAPNNSSKPTPLRGAA